MAGLVLRRIVHVRYECVCENEIGQWVSVIFAYLCREPCHGHLCPRQSRRRHRSAPVTKRGEVRRSVTQQRRMFVEENRLELPA